MWRKVPLALGAALALSTAACEGPIGPLGLMGPEGPQGPPGTDAVNGCTQCHTGDAGLVAIERQFTSSAHWTTATFERSEASCNPCHTHQGFMAVAVQGGTAPLQVDNPAPINCRTCHQVHTTYTNADYAFTTTAAVDLIEGGVVDLGTGNLCANCHQARAMTPRPAINGSPVTVTNMRYGPHYGTQANIVGAEGFFRFSGSRSYPVGPMPHGSAGCNTCHMVEPFGARAGGHVFRLSYGTGTQLVRACTQCHHAATNFNFLGTRAEVQAMLAELKTLLMAEGILREDGYAYTGQFHANVAAAFLNYKAIYYDHSYGAHHPEFVTALLTNTIEAMRARQ
jgi:hypothetical protein